MSGRFGTYAEDCVERMRCPERANFSTSTKSTYGGDGLSRLFVHPGVVQVGSGRPEDVQPSMTFGTYTDL